MQIEDKKRKFVDETSIDKRKAQRIQTLGFFYIIFLLLFSSSF